RATPVRLFFLLLLPALAAGQTNLPDLIMWGPTSTNFQIVNTTYASTNCAVSNMCVQAGDRRILRFSAETRNLGPGDLIVGSPSNSPLFVFSDCVHNWQFKQAAE